VLELLQYGGKRHQHSNMLNVQRIIYLSSIFLFLISGIGIWWIGKRPSSRQAQKCRALTIGLWGFEPAFEAAQLHENNVWNWRKLILAGLLVSSLVINTMSNKFKPGVSISVGVAIMIVWVIALLLFWKYAIQGNPTEANRIVTTDGSSNSVKTSDAWLNKTKSSEGGDNRLPVTVITGKVQHSADQAKYHILKYFRVSWKRQNNIGQAFAAEHRRNEDTGGGERDRPGGD
jgi:hypothetical protein